MIANATESLYPFMAAKLHFKPVAKKYYASDPPIILRAPRSTEIFDYRDNEAMTIVIENIQRLSWIL